MSSPFLAEIRIFACNFAPTGWAQCNGQLLPLSQNTALFSLLGTFYGGDGKTTFALPNLQSSVALGQGQSNTGTQYFLGQQSGVENVTLLQTEMPIHAHTLRANINVAETPDPGGNSFARGSSINIYQTDSSQKLVGMAFQALSVSGGSLPHNNMQPFLVLNFCIALQGVFPPRS